MEITFREFTGRIINDTAAFTYDVLYRKYIQCGWGELTPARGLSIRHITWLDDLPENKDGLK